MSIARYIPFVLGLALLLFAIPLFLQSLVLLPGDMAIFNLLRDRTVSKQNLEILIRSRELSTSFVESGKSWNEKALALIHLGIRARGSLKEKDTYMALARQAQEKGSTLKPGNTFGWLRMVYIERNLPSLSGEKAAAALAMSYLTGPYESRIADYRLKISLEIWDSLSIGAKEAAFRELKLIGVANPERMAYLKKNNPDLRRMANGKNDNDG